MQSIGVFGESAIANLAVTEDLFNVPERMLHLGTNTGFDFLGFQLVGIQFLPGARPFGNELGDVFAILMLIPLLNPKITGITEHALLATVQQVTGAQGISFSIRSRKISRRVLRFLVWYSASEKVI